MPSKHVSPIERWRAEADKLPAEEVKLTVPFHVLLGEAVDVARFYEKHFASTPERAGIDSVQDERRGLTERTAEELMSLREATQQANTDYLCALSPGAAAPMDRALYVVNEITAALEWLFADGVEDENDLHVATVKQTHAETPDSHDAWAAELDDWAGLAARHRADLKGLGGFDVALIDEAKSLAAVLRDRPATPAVLPREVAEAKDLRDRLAAVLYRRMQSVRSAARFVFRRAPETARQATSAYERRRRAAARRAKASSPPSPDK